MRHGRILIALTVCALLFGCSHDDNLITNPGASVTDPGSRGQTATTATATPVEIWTAAVHSGTVAGIGFDADGDLLASAGGTELTILSAADGSVIETFDGFPQSLQSAAVSPDGRYAATGYIIPASGYNPPQPIAVLIDRQNGQATTFASGAYVAFSADGNHLVVGGGGTDYTVEVYAVTNGALVARFNVGGGYVTSVASSPTANLVAAGTTGDNVVLYDMDAQAITATLSDLGEDVADVVFSFDGQFVAAGANGYTAGQRHIAVWRTSGTLAAKFDAFEVAVRQLGFSVDGAYVFAGGRDGVYPDLRAAVKIFDLLGNLLDTDTRLATSLAVCPAGSGLVALGGTVGEVTLQQYTVDGGSGGTASVHVADVSATTEQVKRKFSRAVAHVTVVDQDAQPVAGATVVGSFNSDNDVLTAVTDASGVATFESSRERFAPDPWCFEVSGVQADSPYDSAQDVETMDCASGTTARAAF